MHYEEITSELERRNIAKLLTQYIEEVKSLDVDIDVYSSSDLARKYLFDIAEYFRGGAHFVRLVKLRHSLLYGFLIDSLLFLSGVLSKIHYVPVATSIFLLYYAYVVVFKERQGRVYGMYY